MLLSRDTTNNRFSTPNETSVTAVCVVLDALIKTHQYFFPKIDNDTIGIVWHRMWFRPHSLSLSFSLYRTALHSLSLPFRSIVVVFIEATFLKHYNCGCVCMAAYTNLFCVYLFAISAVWYSSFFFPISLSIDFLATSLLLAVVWSFFG